jgi:type II secretory pathway component GspD/PulD (secretin)
MSVAVAIALAPAGLQAQTQAPTETASPAESANTRPSQVHVAFRSGTQCYQQGDYDRAASYFQQAQAGLENLSAADQQSLAQWVQLNSTALKARRDGGDLLKRAEEAMASGRTQDALTYLKAVTPNQQFLSAADKQRFQQLSERLMPLGTDKTEPASSGPVGKSGSQALARSKVKQARLLLSNGNYAAAQALAQEADRIGASYTATEDTPQKVLADINQARLAAAKPGDAKSLLTAARAALARGELDRAEQLAHQADKAQSVWTKTTHLFGDSPSKVLKDVQVARSKQLARKNSPSPVQQASSKSISPSTQNQDKSTTTTADNTEVARRLLKDARLALQAGNVAEAKQLAERARALKPDLKWWDDTPDKLLAEIRQVEGAKAPGQTKDVAESKKADPRAMVKQARQLFDAGKIDEAEKLALQASRARPPRRGWGVFEDTPDKLLVDVKKARSKNDQEESVRVLAQARKLYEQGNYAEAKQLAHKAERLHGPYSLLDLGDRPAKLLVDIQTAESKKRSNQVPPAPTGLVKKDDAASHAAPASPTGSQKTENSQVRADYTPQRTENSQLRADGAASPYATRQTGVTVAAQTGMPSEMGGDKKFQAQMLLKEARQFQMEGRLVEARQRALAAQKVGVVFGPDEDRPEQALLAIGALCQRRIENLMQQANEALSMANADASRYAWAAQQLTQARTLAVTFGFDTQLIDLKLASVQRAQGSSGITAAAPGMPSAPRVTQVQHQEPVSSPQNHGKTLLDQARRELYAGNTASARRLAEAAYEPQYGVQTEAEQVLRSIDAEEFNQKLLTANRAYDAGVEAFRQQRYAQAATIFRGIDPHQLTPERQARLKEIMLVPEMQPTRVVQAGGQRPGVDQNAGPGMATNQVGRARASDLSSGRTPPDADFAKQVLAMQEVRFQALRNDGLEAQRRAMELFKAGETDRALEVLEEYKGNLNNSGLDSERVAMLRGHIDSRLQQLKTLKHQRDFEKLQANQKEALDQERLHKILNEEEKNKRVAELMKQYQNFYKEGKYQEAQVAALKARDLDPDNPAAGLAVYQSEMMANTVKYKHVKEAKEKAVVDYLDDAEDPGPMVTPHDPLHVDPERTLNGLKRKPIEILSLSKTKSEKEREIYRKLDGPISSMDFKDTPLKQVLEDLQGWTGINIVPDTTALNEAGISVDRPVTMKLENIMLKSALNLLLRQVHLTYVVKDEVLQITTEENARGKQETRIHPVVDLVIPVENSTGSLATTALQALGQGSAPNLQLNGVSPYQSLNSMAGGKTVSPGQMLNNMAGTGTMGAPTVTKEYAKNTTEEVLIRLITNTIAPQTWTSVGGQGTIEFFPIGMALVINQTPDIQEQVAELLQALRRLQDQEVAVEMRFITISESFFERIGLNFNINIRNNQTKYEPQLVSQQFKPFGFINHFTPSNFISGLTPAGTFTQDLNIPIPNNSFNMAIPPFGQYPNIPGNNGGLSMGLAFLSDIEVYLFMEAAQGDSRTNVMEAPKLTMFNGQFATITIADLQFFVTSVTVAQVGGQVVFVPQNNPIPTGGLTMGILPTISADRRFVRLSVTPTLTQLANNNVPLFPVTTFITPIFEGGAVGQPIPFTQFLQQPALNTITVNTTVNVPDGGTVLIGGLKRLLEGRNEFGPPILSKIPYIDRLFKNIGYGRDAESLMIMITPRIIINEEEELRQVPGLAAPAAPPAP